MRPSLRLATLTVAILVAPAVPSARGAEATTTVATAAEAGFGPCGWATGPPPAQFDHVVWIIYENKRWDMIFGSGWAPYIAGLAAQCGRADNMHHVYPKSLPNYIALTSGTTGGITSNRDPSYWPQSQVSLFEQLNGDWRQLNESMPENCALKKSGDYTVNHSPAHYYTRIREECRELSVPMMFPPDISARFTLIIPNKIHDMHRTDSTPTQESRVRAGDEWTSQVMPQLLASPEYQAGRTVIILTWDEANQRTSRIPFVVISPYTAPGTVSNTAFNHYSVLKATEQMLGITTFLAGAADPAVTSIRPDFNLG